MNHAALAINARAAWQLAHHRRAAGGAAILAYHDVTADAQTDERYTVSGRQLRDHIATLRRLGLRIVPLTEIVARLQRGEPVDDLAALTFDDALVGVHHVALEILTEAAAPATIFVVADGINVSPSWWPGAQRTMTTGELDEAMRAGVSLEAHSSQHRSLPRSSAADLAEDLAHCRRVLADDLGSNAELLAYPFGHHDGRVRDAARACGYRAAFTFLNGRAQPGDDLFKLARLTATRTMSRITLARHLARLPHDWHGHQADVVLDGGPSS